MIFAVSRILELSETLIQQFNQNTWPELIAVTLAVAYLLLAIREHIACWYAAFASTLIYLLIFFNVRLYMESGLQIYYLIMAVYGWYEWNQGGEGSTPVQITTWNMRQHVIAVTLILVATLISNWALTNYTDARLPLLDSFTTWGAIVTTFMVARKILENWIYWLVIDSVSIYLYLDRELYFTSMLFAVYIVLIFFGWFTWLRNYQQYQKI